MHYKVGPLCPGGASSDYIRIALAIPTVPQYEDVSFLVMFLFANLRFFHVGDFHESIDENKIINHPGDGSSVFAVDLLMEGFHLGGSDGKPLSRH